MKAFTYLMILTDLGEGEDRLPRLLSLVLRDAAARAAFYAAYEGPYDAIDALWWRVNPDSPAPSGSTRPSATASELRSAFGRPTDGADQEPFAAAVKSLQKLQRDEVANEVALDAALDRMFRWLGARESSPLTQWTALRQWSRRRRALVSFGAIAVLAGSVLAWTVTLPPSSLGVFERPQSAEERAISDELREAGNRFYNAESARIVARSGQIRFVVMTATGPNYTPVPGEKLVCVVRWRGPGSSFRSGCTELSTFTRTGIENRAQDGAPGYRWGPTGDFTLLPTVVD